MVACISRCLCSFAVASTFYQAATVSQDDYIVRRQHVDHLQVQISPDGEVLKSSVARPAAGIEPTEENYVRHTVGAKSAKEAAGLLQTSTHSMANLARTRSLFSFRSFFGSNSTSAPAAFPNMTRLSVPAIPAKPSKTIYQSGMFIALVVFAVAGAVLSVTASILARSGAAPAEPGSSEAEAANADSGGSDQPDRFVEKEINCPPEGLDEDIYGMGIAAIIRDMQRFAMKTELRALRMSRLGLSLLTLAFTATLQVFLLCEMKQLVTSVSTLETRTAYDKYEVWMYGNNKSGMTKTENGYYRGVPGNFNISQFATLDDDVKDNACQIPLSQPTFFIGVLLIWTLVIVADMRRVVNLGGALVRYTPTIDSMKDACEDAPDHGDEAVVVVGLTAPVKAIICTFILVPRLLVSGVLLWLGCRWLCGTMGFSDILQNTVTLEFILLLKDLFYHTMAPHHNKIEARNTFILPNASKLNPSAPVFIGAFAWGFLAIAWVLLYVECLQQVLPEYNWDIHDACQNYLASIEGLS